MINEYLFLSDEHRVSVELYKPDEIAAVFSTIIATPLWIAAYSVTGSNEDSAKKLSDLHTFIMQFSPMTLTCESSEYYNRMLFPQVNEFERKLRKILYLAASISDNRAAQDTIRNLEDKTLGVIFDMLFVDTRFVNNTKNRINGTNEFKGKASFSKSELQDYISSIEEYTLWDSLFDGDCVGTIKSRFRDIFDYRNKVMHAHNIGKEVFGKARYLFDKVNKELGCEIGKIIGKTDDESSAIKSNVNASITSALEALELSITINEQKAVTSDWNVSQSLAMALQRIQPTITPEWTEAIKRSSVTLPLGLAEAIKNFRVLQLDTSALENIKKQMRQLDEITQPYKNIQAMMHLLTELQDALRATTSGLSWIASEDIKSEEPGVTVVEPYATDKDNQKE